MILRELRIKYRIKTQSSLKYFAGFVTFRDVLIEFITNQFAAVNHKDIVIGHRFKPAGVW